MRLVSNSFSTELPSGWEDRSMMTLLGPRDATGFASNIVIVRERIGSRVSVEDYAARQRAAMEREIAAIEVLDERPARINGSPAYQRLQRFSAQGHRVQQAQTFILREGTVFVVTCTAALSDFDNHLDAFRKVVDEFRWVEPV